MIIVDQVFIPVITAIFGFFLGFGIWKVKDIWDIKNLAILTHFELEHLSKHLHNLMDNPGSFKDPSTIIYPINGVLHEIKQGFIRFPDISTNLLNIYIELITVDEKFREIKFRLNDPNSEFPDIEKTIITPLQKILSSLQDTTLIILIKKEANRSIQGYLIIIIVIFIVLIWITIYFTSYQADMPKNVIYAYKCFFNF